MQTVYTVLGMITFYTILAYLAYEYVYPYFRAIVLAFDFIRWANKNTRTMGEEVKNKDVPYYKVYGYAYRRMLEAYKDQRRGVKTELTHYSGATYRPFK